jgi:ABC-2 type transport system ATP-binding protein
VYAVNSPHPPALPVCPDFPDFADAPSPAPGYAIRVRDLVKTYPTGFRALNGISFTVPPGTLFVLLGSDGAGKSTTVRILTALIRADSGNAVVAGYDVRAAADAVRRVIGVAGYKPGGGRAGTGRENLTLQGRRYGLQGTELADRVDELLCRFGLRDAADREVRRYSGGMYRRLDLAMALVHRPRILFLDEPTTGLDLAARTGMWQQISALRDEGVTILLTTRSLAEADRLADRLAIVDRGRAVVEGAAAELTGRLRGDAIRIELAEPARNGAVRAALSDIAGLGEVVLGERSLRVRADDGAAAVPAMLTALADHGVPVTSVKVARPSLYDVYLRYTGRPFRDLDDDSGRAPA